MTKFQDYTSHGWKLVALNEGDKNPVQRGWNVEELTLSSIDDLDGLKAAGLAHAYSNTCAIDIDDMAHSIEYLDKFDIDLEEYWNAPNAVKITSGRKNRGKLIYALDEPLRSLKLSEKIDGKKKNFIDFRCATADGLTVQDALPPSIHPKTKKPYEWLYNDDLIGDWKDLPPLPDALLEFWKTRIVDTREATQGSVSDLDEEQLTKLTQKLDADCDYSDWLNVGMALHNATEGDQLGFDVWDNWSSTGEKYEGRKDLIAHWRSFRGEGITIDYLLMQQVADPEVFEDVTNQKPPKAKKSELKFPLVRIGDWVERPPPEWLIHDVLPQSELAMMFGQPGSGKSFLAMDIALAIATDVDWRDKTTKGGPVIWIAAEAAGSIRNRALAYARHHKITLTDCPFWIIGDTPDLNSVEHVREICRSAHPIKPKLVVIDTMVAASGGANENSGEDMAVILQACRVIHKVTGALILLIHHSGKDASKGSRGWSGMKGAMQTELEVTHKDTGERIAKIIKQRDGEQDVEYPFRLRPVTLSLFNDVPQNSCVVIAEDGVMIAELDVSPSWTSAYIHTLMNKGTDEIREKGMSELLYDAAINSKQQVDDIDESIDAFYEFAANSGKTLLNDKKITLVSNDILS